MLSSSSSTFSRLTREQRIARLRDALAREISRDREEKRKRETRAKIVLGGALIAFFRSENVPSVVKSDLLNQVLLFASERDRSFLSSFSLFSPLQVDVDSSVSVSAVESSV